MKRLYGPLNTEQREWLLLISACFLKLIAGQSLSGGVYANCLKASFGLNQRQLDLCMALMSMGTLLIVVSGAIFDRCGARISVLLGAVFSTLTSAFLAIALAHPQPLRDHLWLLYTLLFLYGHSFNYGYVAAIACCMSSFQSNRRGYIMCLLDNSFSLGPPVVALVYYVVFDNTHRSQDAQDPVGTLVVMTCLTAGVHAFAYAFLKPLDGPLSGEQLGEATPILQTMRSTTAPKSSEESEDEDEELGIGESGGSSTSTVSSESKSGQSDSRSDQDCLEVTREFISSCCCSRRFLPLLLAVSLAMAPNLVSFLNLTSITRSLGLTQYDVYYIWFPNLSAIAWRCLIGPLTDRYFPLAYQRSSVLLLCLACLGTPAALMLSAPVAAGASPLGVTMAAAILAALSASAVFTLIPVIISQTEARHLFGRLYSACLVTGSLLSLPLMLQFGALYDSHSLAVTSPPVPPSNATRVEYECRGQSCFVYGGAANTACHLASLAFLTFYTMSLKLTSS